MLSRLAAHFSRYSLASLLVTLASIVSFPFLTRIFPVADYGMMSLIGVLVTATAAVGKLGLQQAALRFYSEVRAGQSAWTLPQYEATVYVGLAGFGTLAATGLIVGESLFGVVYAGIAGATGSESPLALPFIHDGFTPIANVLGIVFFAGATWLLYGFARKITRDADRDAAAKAAE